MKRAFGWALLATSSILWIAAIFGLVAQNEPQIVLHLSIAAIWLGALDGLWIAQKDNKQNGNDGP